MVDHNSGVGDCSITWDVANSSVRKKKDGVSGFGDASTSLCQAMEFFANCLEPKISKQEIFDQLLVMGDVSLVTGCTTPLQYSLISTTGPVY
jgi:hypothetical protein